MAEVSSSSWLFSDGVNDDRPLKGFHNPIESCLWYLGATSNAATFGDMTVLWQVRTPKIRATGTSRLSVKSSSGRPFREGQADDLAATTGSRSAATGTTTAGATATGTTAGSAATASASTGSASVFFYYIFGEPNLSGVWNQYR